MWIVFWQWESSNKSSSPWQRRQRKLYSLNLENKSRKGLVSCWNREKQVFLSLEHWHTPSTSLRIVPCNLYKHISMSSFSRSLFAWWLWQSSAAANKYAHNSHNSHSCLYLHLSESVSQQPKLCHHTQTHKLFSARWETGAEWRNQAPPPSQCKR